MVRCSDLSLSSGYTIPVVGLGTWLSPPEVVAEAVKVALRNGYKHVDCAFAYLNQKQIGEALSSIFSEGHIKREDIFITSKVWNTFHSYQRAIENVHMILRELRLKYLDLCLIHWPHGYEEHGAIFPEGEPGKMRYSAIDYLETWRALETCVEQGIVRSIGVSNFNHKQILRIIENCKINPSVLQVERHPYFQQKKLIEFCSKHKIVFAAYSPLGNPSMPFKGNGTNIMNNPIVKEIAENHRKTAAQVIIRWHIQSMIVCVPKSVNEERIIENFNVFDFVLDSDEMLEIDRLDKDSRFLDLTSRDGDHEFFPFHEDF